MRPLILLMLFVSLLAPVSAVVINEIMPHTNNFWGDEWLELYNPTNGTVVLNAWKIGDLSSNDTFSLNISAAGFGLIVDSGTGNNTGCAAFNISAESCIALSTIGSGLNDGAETVFLYDAAGNLIDTFSWSTNIKSSGHS